MEYRTNDGRIFNNSAEAQTHANSLEIESRVRRAELNVAIKTKNRALNDEYNKLVRYFNASEWNNIINATDEEAKLPSPPLFNFNHGARLMRIIALANTDRIDNYKEAFFRSNWGKPSHGDIESVAKLLLLTNEALKNSWGRANGRPMTDTDIAKLKNEWDNKSSSSNEKGYGKYDDKRGVVSSIILGLVAGIGAVFTGGLFFNHIIGREIPGIPMLVVLVGISIITFLAWRNRKTLLFIVMLAIGIIGYLGLFDVIPDKQNTTPTEQIEEEQ